MIEISLASGGEARKMGKVRLSDEVVWTPAMGAVFAADGLDRFWQAEPQWLVLWTAVLAVLVTVAWYVVGKIRPKPSQKERPASEWLSKYRDLHSKGVLSDEEFRTIKTRLAKQLQDELNSNDEKG